MSVFDIRELTEHYIHDMYCRATHTDVAGAPIGDTACGVPHGSQRNQYDFATAGDRGPRGLWWYGLSGGGFRASSNQRKCTAAERQAEADSCHFLRPSWIIDHSAIRNRLGQWATFRYDVHGELTWAIAEGFANPGPIHHGYNGELVSWLHHPCMQQLHDLFITSFFCFSFSQS